MPNQLASDHPILNAKACFVPNVPLDGHCRLLFRRVFSCAENISNAVLFVSASQRCRVWLDEQEIAAGPARSDRERWECMEINLDNLQPGKHILAIEVIHWGKYAGKGQIGGTAFLLTACNIKCLQLESDNENWRCFHDTSRSPYTDYAPKIKKGHYAIGAGECLCAELYPWHWQSIVFNDELWIKPKLIPESAGNSWGNRSLGCHLIPQSIPLMQLTSQKWKRIQSHSDLSISTNGNGQIPANSKYVIIFDAGVIMNAIPLVMWSGGNKARIELVSCEAPVNTDGQKGNRDIIEGCILPGQGDLIICDGGKNRTWSPPWMRAFRYLELEIQTQDENLEINAVEFMRTNFPLENKLNINIEDSIKRPWQQLITVNRDTIAACSHETIMDCPAWEQAQFPGDSRIIARHHYLANNEDRLAIKAINDFAASRVASGLLRSHWPSQFEQVISTYSLQWIGMLWDLWCYRARKDVVSEHLPVARGIIAWFINQRRNDKLLGWISEAPFIDWAFKCGNAPQESDGGSALLTALCAETCGMLAELEEVCGYPELAPRWRNEKQIFLDGINNCWDENKGLLADTSNKKTFSIHTQIQAILAGYWTKEKAGEILISALNRYDITQSNTLYYRAFIFEAMRKCNRLNQTLDLLNHWFNLLKVGGITTWPESDNNPRSDCHGWGSTPEVEIIHNLCGLTTRTPGWRSINLNPFMGNLQKLAVSLTLPSGQLDLSLENKEKFILAKITSPVEIYLSNNTNYKQGTHQIEISTI